MNIFYSKFTQKLALCLSLSCLMLSSLSPVFAVGDSESENNVFIRAVFQNPDLPDPERLPSRPLYTDGLYTEEVGIDGKNYFHVCRSVQDKLAGFIPEERVSKNSRRSLEQAIEDAKLASVVDWKAKLGEKKFGKLSKEWKRVNGLPYGETRKKGRTQLLEALSYYAPVFSVLHLQSLLYAKSEAEEEFVLRLEQSPFHYQTIRDAVFSTGGTPSTDPEDSKKRQFVMENIELIFSPVVYLHYSQRQKFVLEEIAKVMSHLLQLELKAIPPFCQLVGHVHRERNKFAAWLLEHYEKRSTQTLQTVLNICKKHLGFDWDFVQNALRSIPEDFDLNSLRFLKEVGFSKATTLKALSLSPRDIEDRARQIVDCVKEGSSKLTEDQLTYLRMCAFCLEDTAEIEPRLTAILRNRETLLSSSQADEVAHTLGFNEEYYPYLNRVQVQARHIIWALIQKAADEIDALGDDTLNASADQKKARMIAVGLILIASLPAVLNLF